MSFINIKWCHISYAIRAIQLYSCQICNLILDSNLHSLIPRYITQKVETYINSEDILGLLVLFSVILVILSLVYLINIEGPIIQSQVGFAGRKKKVMMKRREDARIMLQAVEESLLLCCFRSFHFTTKEEKTMVYEFLEKPPLFLTILSVIHFFFPDQQFFSIDIQKFWH